MIPVVGRQAGARALHSTSYLAEKHHDKTTWFEWATTEETKVVWCETLEHVQHALQSLWFVCCTDARSANMTLFGVVRLSSMCRLSFSCIQFVTMPIVICQCRVSKLPLEAMSKPKQSPRTKPAVEMQQQNDMERSTKKQRKDIIMLDHGEAVAPPKLRIFTDFSGMEAPCLALEGLGVDYLHVGACEKSPSLQKFIRKNVAPQLLYKDRGLQHTKMFTCSCHHDAFT